MKKAQQSVEFLFTYGWAILAVSVSIGALAYFNVVEPATFVSSECDLGPQFACTEYAIYDNYTLTMNIRNNHNINITINNLTLSYTNNQIVYTDSFNLSPNEQTQIYINLPINSLSTRQSAPINIRLNFKGTQSSNNYEVTGRILTGIIPS
jgi:hypothetical protein